MSAPEKIEQDEVASVSHEELLRRIGQNQDREAFIELFNYFAPRLKSFLLRNGLREDRAEDLMQDVMLTVWNRAADYNERLAKASTWIFTIARNRRIDYLRKFSRPEPSLEVVPEEFLQSEEKADPVTKREERKTIANLLETLSPEQAELIRKSFFEDKAHGAIANEMNIPLGTVKSRIRLGLQKMRDTLKDKEAWL
ncbi:MAG: sigma-70 family RNA polymerase sigma factor [Alphaproteobacteria bacterium]|nr:sigma-70 family RNA polymerase sigma factor [Alphaproteobacteria bacterium]